MYANWLFNSLAFLAVFSLHCINEVTSWPLVGARLAGKGQFGYHVSVEKFNTSFCGGGIIDERYVVSAAHCFVNKENQLINYPLKVVAGTEDINGECKHKVTADVEQIFIPAEFDFRDDKKNSRWIGDIAILKLKTELGIKKHKYLKKLKLPIKEINYDDKTVVVTGFGYNEFNYRKNFSVADCGSRDGKLRYAKATVINKCKCGTLTKKPIGNKHLCAAAIQADPNNPVGVCKGDSGGPLVYKQTQLIGIVSTSPKSCREDKAPAVYTKVWPFVDFIAKVRNERIDASLRNITLVSAEEWELLALNLIEL